MSPRERAFIGDKIYVGYERDLVHLCERLIAVQQKELNQLRERVKELEACFTKLGEK